jgi:hypothetical protein
MLGLWASRKLGFSGRASFCGDFQMDGNGVFRDLDVNPSQNTAADSIIAFLL